MSPSQINNVFETLLKARTQNGEPASQPRREEPPKPQIDFKAAFDPNSEHYDPESALRAFAETNYGGLMQQISSRTVSGLYANLRSRIHDWQDFESEVNEIVSKIPSDQVDEGRIFGTYLAIKGKRAFDNERRARSAGASTHQPSPSQEVPVEEPLQPEEREIARSLFPKATDPEQSYKDYKKKIGIGDNTAMTVKVPTGEGRTE